MNTPAKPALPELPKQSLLHTQMPDHHWYGSVYGYTVDQMREYARAAIDAAVAEARTVPVPYFNRRAVEREIESNERPPPGTLRLNDGKERVTLPGGTLRRMLQIIDALSATPSSTDPAMPAERTCIECGGPLQWRCPACRIAQSAQAAMPVEPIGYLTRSVKMAIEQRECFPGEEPNYLWQYTHGTKDLERFERAESLEVIRLYASPHPAPSVAVPEGWSITRQKDGSIAVRGPGCVAVSVRNGETCPRVIPTQLLYELADAMLASSPQPPTQQEGS